MIPVHKIAIAAAVLSLTAAACKEEPPPPLPQTPIAAPPTAAPPPPEPNYSDEALLKAMEDCHSPAIATHDAKKIASCWTANGKLTVPGMPTADGQAAIEGMMAGFFGAFGDLKVTPQLTLITHVHVAQVRHLSGSNTGEFMGAPPTGKKFGLLTLAVDHLKTSGKIEASEHYFDAPTLMAQIGMAKTPMRPVLATPGDKRVVKTSGSETETANQALLNAGHAAFNARDWKTLLSVFADDAVISDQTLPKDIMGKQAIAGLFKTFVGAFSDVRFNNTAVWPAGDYVLSQATLDGTNDGNLPMMKLKKTGKPISLHVAEIALVQGGKVKQLWWFGNGAEMAAQLGLAGEKK